MEDDDPLERLQSLQRDLLLFMDSRLANIQRLELEIDASMADFRRLLDKKKRSQASRDALSASPSGNSQISKVKLSNEEYSINQEFREGAIQVADELDLDELEAAQLYLAVSASSDGYSELLPLRAILRFQNQREALTECVRLLCKKGANADLDDGEAQLAQNAVREIMGGGDAPPSERSAFWRRCIDGLTVIQEGLKKTQDHVQMFAMTGRDLNTPHGEMLQAQRMLLTRQHEALASTMTHLITSSYVFPEDYRGFLSKAAAADTTADVMVHYAPILLAGSAHFGSSDSTTDDAARDLHRLFAPGPGQLQWKAKMYQSATTIWWLAEYSARFGEPSAHSSVREGPLAKLEQERSKLFTDCCEGKAFHLMLGIADFLRTESWYDPAKAGLVGFLLDNSVAFSHDTTAPSREFASLVMELMQEFVGAFVSNMPDLLRKLKTQEDDVRRRVYSLPVEGVQPDSMDLERLMLVVAGAYQEDAEAAEDFWSDPGGNLCGFLRWASQRLPTPRVAAFCQLLKAISGDTKSANNTHRFLLGEMSLVAGQPKIAHAVSWAQIFGELEVFATQNKGRPAVLQDSIGRADGVKDVNITEKETPIMLEAYIRLAAHVCENSPAARHWILREQPFPLHEYLLRLVQSNSPPNVQSSCFDLLAALLTDKTVDINDGVWTAIDSWLSGGMEAGNGRQQTTAAPRPPPAKQYLKRIAENAEIATSFVHLLNALMEPVRNDPDALLDPLPFPESLGSSHRRDGMEPYVDFVLGQVLALPMAQPSLMENRLLCSVLRHACLTFAWLALSTFNESLVVLANTSSLAVEKTIKTESLQTYVRLHPFARTMEHMFSNNTILALYDCLHPAVEEMEAFDSASPVVQMTTKAIQVMDLVMRLQPTYFSIVRPVIKISAPTKSDAVANPAIASFDEVMLSQLPAMGFVYFFVASKHLELSLSAISLLGRLSTSSKLTSLVDPVSGQRVGNRLVGSVQPFADAVAEHLRDSFTLDATDFEQGVKEGTEPLRITKARALVDFLSSSLDASKATPTIAHTMLGLLDANGRISNVISEGDGLFASGTSLFHAIARCANDLPTGADQTNLSWLLSLKRGCTEIMTKLAAATLTAPVVQSELRSLDFLPAIAISLLETRPHGLWDDLPPSDSAVLLKPGGSGIRDFMQCRDAYFEYAGLELRALSDARMDSLRGRQVNALLGAVIEPNDEDTAAASILQLIDFSNIEVAAPPDISLRHYEGVDLSPCISEPTSGTSSFDLDLAAELLAVRRRELYLSGDVCAGTTEAQQLEDEETALLASLFSQNAFREIQQARLDATEAWTDVVSTIVTAGGLNETDLTMFALQALQVVLSRLEKSLGDDMDAAGLFARLTLTLISASVAASFESDLQASSSRAERLHTTFHVCVKAICDSETSLVLRDVCYRSCCLVLADTITPPALSPPQRSKQPPAATRQLLLQVQTAGERLIRVITEDAFSGRGTTRISALLFLDALLPLFAATATLPILLRSLTKLNFIPVLLDSSITTVSHSFRNADADLPTALSYFHTALSLILNLARASPEGSSLLLTSGLFQAIADSNLFATDPDIGLDIDNLAALRQFYRLLSVVLRVVTAVVVSKGPSNGSVLHQAKAFLTQNRTCMMAVFKRVSKLDRTAGPPEVEAKEVAEEFGRLVVISGWLEDDEPAEKKRTRMGGFT
nr:hypothetical protein B0A51_08472 [Rachicladosporium sp. CCFEE 5018]